MMDLVKVKTSALKYMTKFADKRRSTNKMTKLTLLLWLTYLARSWMKTTLPFSLHLGHMKNSAVYIDDF